MSVVAESVDNRLRVDKLFDINLLAKHITDGVVRKQTHPTLPLSIFSYTEKAQYGGIWDEVTNECRGLIVDDAGYVVARPFRKFHNLNTASVPETLEANLPDSAPEVTKKLDGSLGIFWRYSGECGIATRGSFTSVQAQWATRWHAKHVHNIRWPDAYTPLFEIIYPENRIVCNYDFEGLVLLAMVNKQDGAELSRKNLRVWSGLAGVKVVDNFQKTLAECVAENNSNEEGYVLTWHKQPVPGGRPPLKVKVKFADYVRLHRVVTGLNPKDVWEMLALGKDSELLALVLDEKMPDHFRKWLRGWSNKLLLEFEALECEAVFILSTAYEALGMSTRKDYALFFQAQAKDKRLLPILFTMFDNNDPASVIWKQIKPSGATTTFRKDGE